LHFLLAPVGSTGDVLPFIGIGRALRVRGHDVTLVASQRFGRATEQAGLRFVGTHSEQDYHRFTNDPDLWHPRRGVLKVMHAVASYIRADFARIEQTFDPGRTVLVGHSLNLAARTFEEIHHVPAATLHLAPSLFRSDYEQPTCVPGVDWSHWPVWVKRSLWWSIDRWVFDSKVVPELNRWRRELGLSPISRPFKTWAHSECLVIGLFPNWFAPRQPDWPSHFRLTGFPLYDTVDTKPSSPGLRSFLNGGSPPVVLTFGTANQTAKRYLLEGLEAIRRLGRRALVLTHYPEQLPAALGPDCWHESYAPLSLVLPRSAAIVHHGGIGTCAQGLAAGIPQLTMPMSFDQPDNAARLSRLGVGRWVRPSAFRAERVAADLSSILEDPGVADRCRHWADEMRQGDALADTCSLLEALIAQ
jgi:UDP:flavonoid glycosyltransferase YjiC (YdhE family)